MTVERDLYVGQIDLSKVVEVRINYNEQAHTKADQAGCHLVSYKELILLSFERQRHGTIRPLHHDHTCQTLTYPRRFC